MSQDTTFSHDGAKTILLNEPVKFGDQEFREIRLKEPTAGQWKEAARKDGFDSTILLISLVSGVPFTAIEKMPIRKVNEAGRYLLSFLEDAPMTGDSA